jgi:hypothetical protein
MTLHLSHIFLTEGRTFICVSFRKYYNELVVLLASQVELPRLYLLAQPQA